LVQFLPLKARSNLCHAHQQLDPAFSLLTQAGIIAKVTWGKPRNPQDLALLCLYRGRLLSSEGLLPFPEQEEPEAEVIEVQEIHLGPEELVAKFYQLWDHTKPEPTKKELVQAKELIEQHGPAKAKDLVPLVVNRLRKEWPEAKRFGAAEKYFAEVATEYDRQQATTRRKKDQADCDREDRERVRKERECEKEFRATWQPVWDAAPQAEQDEIREKVKAKNAFYREGKLASFFEHECLKELAQRRAMPQEEPR
jgi:hypothetical protein